MSTRKFRVLNDVRPEDLENALIILDGEGFDEIDVSNSQEEDITTTLQDGRVLTVRRTTRLRVMAYTDVTEEVET